MRDLQSIRDEFESRTKFAVSQNKALHANVLSACWLLVIPDTASFTVVVLKQPSTHPSSSKWRQQQNYTRNCSCFAVNTKQPSRLNFWEIPGVRDQHARLENSRTPHSNCPKRLSCFFRRSCVVSWFLGLLCTNQRKIQLIAFCNIAASKQQIRTTPNNAAKTQPRQRPNKYQTKYQLSVQIRAKEPIHGQVDWKENRKPERIQLRAAKKYKTTCKRSWRGSSRGCT